MYVVEFLYQTALGQLPCTMGNSIQLETVDEAERVRQAILAIPALAGNVQTAVKRALPPPTVDEAMQTVFKWLKEHPPISTT